MASGRDAGRQDLRLYPSLDSDLAVDVTRSSAAAIVNLTAAELLTRASEPVAVVEARKLGQQVDRPLDREGDLAAPG